MSEHRVLLTDMARGLFAELAEATPATVLARLGEAGFASLLVPAERGGFGGDWGDLLAVLRLAGAHALPGPLAEPILAHALLAAVGMAAPEGLVTLALPGQRVAWGRHADAVVVIAQGRLSLHDRSGWTVVEGTSPGDEPSERLTLIGAGLSQADCDVDAADLVAFARVAQAAGALEAAFALTVDHANTRVQFGRPLAQFQAVQQALAEFSEEAAAVDAAAAAAGDALDCRGWPRTGCAGAGFEIAAARLRMGLAIDRAVPIAHRLHGAIGFTRDYRLNHLTRRLIGWRSEGPSDALWAERIGRIVAGVGGAGFWPMLTARSDGDIAIRRSQPQGVA